MNTLAAYLLLRSVEDAKIGQPHQRQLCAQESDTAYALGLQMMIEDRYPAGSRATAALPSPVRVSPLAPT